MNLIALPRIVLGKVGSQILFCADLEDLECRKIDDKRLYPGEIFIRAGNVTEKLIGKSDGLAK